MTREQIIIELQERYESKNKYDLNDIIEFINSHSHTDAEIIFNCIKANHPYQAIPKLAKVKQDLRDDGIQLTRNVKDSFYCQVCEVCNTRFDTNMSACPTCRKRTPVKIIKSDKPIQHIKQGHDDCGYCNIYFRSQKGSICQSWGKEEHPESNSYCNGCSCVNCCKKEYLKNTDYPRYRREVLGFGK